MTSTHKWIGGALMAAMLANPIATAAPAAAAGLPTTHQVAPASPGEVELVGWGRGGRWAGPGAGLAILGGVIVGSALVAAAVAEHRAQPNELRRCGRDFPDFDPRSGTYIDRRGEARVCPYLY